MSRIDGSEALSTNLKGLMSAFPNAINKAVVKTANEVRNNAIKSISREQSMGRVYTHYFTAMLPNGALIEGKKRNKPHTASAPGDAPNTDSGTLVRSIAVENPRKGLSYVGTSVEYGKHLEFGTRRMAARPWLRPAMDKAAPELPNAITNAITEEIQKRRQK